VSAHGIRIDPDNAQPWISTYLLSMIFPELKSLGFRDRLLLHQMTIHSSREKKMKKEKLS